MDADGDFVIAWQSDRQDNSENPFSAYGVYAQRYQANGMEAGSEFLVNTYQISNQRDPNIAMDADGDFVIAWESLGQDGSSNGVYAQRYQANGTKAGLEFLVNTHTTNYQSSPSVAMDADGDFVIAWGSAGQDGSDVGVYAQRYRANGMKAGVEFLVNTTTANNQISPSAAMDADGDFIIAWRSSAQDGSDEDVYAQRYRANGTKAGSEFLVNSVTANKQRSPSIAMDADGDFVIAWESASQDGSAYGIYAQRYQANGTEAGGEFLVNTTTANTQRSPSIAMDANGDFIIAWRSSAQDGSDDGVYAQRYQANGMKAGTEFLVNTHTTNDQRFPSIAMDADGDFVIAWHSNLQDGGGFGVYAQRYAGIGSSSVDLNLVLQDASDPVDVGDNIMYSLITTNNGSGIALDVNLSLPLATGVTYVSDNSAAVGWGCALTAATLNCARPILGIGIGTSIDVTVTADTAGELSHTVTVAAAQIDTDPTDNSDTETTLVEAVSGGSDDDSDDSDDNDDSDDSGSGGSSSSSSSGGGAFSGLSLLLFIPLYLRRRLA